MTSVVQVGQARETEITEARPPFVASIYRQRFAWAERLGLVPARLQKCPDSRDAPLRFLSQFVLPKPYFEPDFAGLRPDVRQLSKLGGEQPQVASESPSENSLKF